MGVFFPPDILGDRWWPQTAKQAGDKISKTNLPGTLVCNKWGEKKNVISALMVEVPLLGVGTVLRLERDAWSMVN